MRMFIIVVVVFLVLNVIGKGYKLATHDTDKPGVLFFDMLLDVVMLVWGVHLVAL